MPKKFFLFLAVAMSSVFLILSFTPTRNLKKFSRSIPHYSSDTTGPLSIKAKGHKGKMLVSKAGVISFSSGLDNDYYQLDSLNRIGYLYLETRLDKFINEKTTRIPLNLSIVIDRSGSMEGDKMQNAKKAAKDIVDKLTPDDFVSIVIYDNEIEVIQTAVQVMDTTAINSKINKVTSRGSTNLWGGTEKGYEQVRANYKKNYVNRVLLISDGLANVGIISPIEIKKKVQDYKDREGITISTFGVGLDYNELLMTDMAEAGAGNYYYIESPNKMAALFDKELNGLLNVAAQNAELTIKLPQEVKLEKVFAFKYDERGSEVNIKFRDLFSEETKGVLLRFSINDQANSRLKFISTLVYDDVSNGQRKILVNENILTPSRNTETYLTYFNKPVLQQTILFIANENMEKAMLEADKGNYNGAMQILDANNVYMRLNYFYRDSSIEIRKLDTLNYNYSIKLQRAGTLSADSMKMLQKSNRAKSYDLRTKKNN